MKKIYMKPAVYMQNVEIESLLAAESGGGQIDSGDAKRNDFWTNDDDEAKSDKLSFNSVWE